MRLPSLRRPTPSFFISVAALVVAAGGTSYAAATIGTLDVRDGSLRSVDVRDGSLRSVDLRDGGVRSVDIADGTLKRRDFRGGALPAGPRGPQGPQGEQGPAGASRWVLIGRDGTIQAQSGGFDIVASYPVLPNTAAEGQPSNALRANGNVYIDAGEDLADNAIVATVVLQNTIEQDAAGSPGAGNTNGRAPGADANPEFSGEITVSRCAFPGSTGIPTNCAPAGAQNLESFVVSPRLSDGSVTTDQNRKAFYVILAGTSPAGR
ncbi:hypothetical protein [Nocardioides perillae]|uniref:Collagen triple helix repeat-containing protein n=1 Tax=Nocardioides perillae TaxID=1119534 RepID=A0A7Y9UJ07_9ACTN|nr:hypothetical protein [Nocardioides perillae]NYG53728.1 hypothetical protein [Nocardioides perillae]